MTAYKGYHVTDGDHEMIVCAMTRSKATGRFLRYFDDTRIDWKRLRTKRWAEFDGDRPWETEIGYDVVECWGAFVRMP